MNCALQLVANVKHMCKVIKEKIGYSEKGVLYKMMMMMIQYNLTLPYIHGHCIFLWIFV